MELARIYESLRAAKPAGRAVGSLRIREVFPRERTGFFAGIRTTTGRQLLLLRCDSSTLPAGRLPKCQGFETRIATYDDAGKDSTWLELEERGSQHALQFRAMVSDVTKRVHSASPASEQSAFLDTVKHWRDAFARNEAGYLDLAEQAGLYAELCFL